MLILHAEDVIMSQKKISVWILLAALGVAVCGTTIYAYIIPVWAQSLVYSNPEFSSWYWPWMCFLWATAIPCYIILLFVFKISGEVRNDNSFSYQTAKYLKNIAVLIFVDIACFFVGNIVLFFLNMNHPGILFVSLIIDIVGIVIALVAVILSHFVYKAAILQEESNGTV